MNSLEITENKAGKLNEIEDLALDITKDVLKGIQPGDSEEAKIAMKTLGIVAKNRQTTMHGKAIEFSMAASIANDKELRRYIKVSTPHVVKALTGKKKD